MPRSGLIGIPIIATARADAQTTIRRIVLHRHLQSVEAILGWRDVGGIKADQILRPELTQDVVEGLIELRAKIGREYAAAGARGERCQRVFAAHIAPSV